MVNELKYKGYFYLPESEDNQVFGTLFYNQSSGIILELAGSLTGVMNHGVFKPDIILGNSLEGKQLTLYKCFENNRHLSSPGFISTRYTAIYLFVGVLFTDANNINFSKAFFHYNNLDQWLDISGFKIDDCKHESDKELNIHYKLPERIFYKLNDNIDFGFSFSHTSFKIDAFQKGIEFEQNSNLFFQFNVNRADLNTILDLSHTFQNFLALATFDVTYPCSITLINPDNFLEYDGNIRHEEIRIYFKRSNLFDEPRLRDKFQMLFTYQQIKDNFQTMFLKWFDIKNDLEPSINLFFDYIYKSKTFTTNHFLNIVHAIETYHRRRFKNYLIEPELHKQRLEKIYKSVPLEHKDWLKEKLIFSHEPSLKERLVEIMKAIKSDELLKVIGNQDEVIKDAKNSRNYYVHFSENLKNKALSGGQLYRLTEKLKFLLIYCLLKDIGFSENTVSELFKNNKHILFGHLNY